MKKITIQMQIDIEKHAPDTNVTEKEEKGRTFTSYESNGKSLEASYP